MFFRSELYTFEDTNRYTVQLAFINVVQLVQDNYQDNI